MDQTNKNIAEEMASKLKVIFSKSMEEYSVPVFKQSRAKGGFITYGEYNQYPQFLLDLYYGSPIHGAIIDGKVAQIAGEGLYDTNDLESTNQFIKKANIKGDSLAIIFRKAALDYVIFGGFALQVVYSVGSTNETPVVAGIYYIDFTKLRYAPDGITLLYSQDWDKPKFEALKYPSFDPTKSGDEKTQILYFNGEMTRQWYPFPRYISAIPSIESDILIQAFQKAQLKNGFFPSILMDFKTGQPTIEEEDDIIERTDAQFGGVERAGKIMYSFSDKDNPGPEITTIDQPDLHERFIALSDSVRDKILFAARISNPIIFGIQIPGKLGGTAREFQEALEGFKTTFVRPEQRIMLEVFNSILRVNDASADLQVMEIPPVNTGFSDENLIASYMSREEVRTHLAKLGYITEEEIVEKVSTSNSESLAEKLSVGALTALQAILIDTTMLYETKRNTLIHIFNLTEEVATQLAGSPVPIQTPLV